MEKERMDRIVEKVAGIFDFDRGFKDKLKDQIISGDMDYEEHLKRVRNLSKEDIIDLLNQRKAQIAEKEAIRSKQLGNLRFMAAHNTKAEMNHLRRLYRIEEDYLKELKRISRNRWLLGGGVVLAAPFVLGGLSGKKKEVNNVYVVGSEPTQ